MKDLQIDLVSGQVISCESVPDDVAEKLKLRFLRSKMSECLDGGSVVIEDRYGEFVTKLSNITAICVITPTETKVSGYQLKERW